MRYQGYRGERLGTRHSASGILNFIQLNDGPDYAFDVLHAARESTLREEFSKWYHRKVLLQGYRLGSRTFLLAQDLSCEQIQAYKQELGVSLYS